MKGYVLKSFKEPLVPAELERPKASPGRVVVRVAAAGVCYRDYLAWQGFQKLLLVVPGHEFAGVVEEVGDGVSEFKPGDAVAGMIYEFCGECDYCRTGREYLCRARKVYGEALPGIFAEYVSVDHKSLVKMPPGVSFGAASYAACVLSTVIRGVKKIGASLGRLVLVTGAGGGVGVHAVQVAKAYGARVMAVTSPQKADYVAKYADYVIRRRFPMRLRSSAGQTAQLSLWGGLLWSRLYVLSTGAARWR